MARSLTQLQKELDEFKKQVQAGLFTQRQPLGPGAISKTLIRSKSIQSYMLDVEELSSVAANTGSLNVTGGLVAGSGANTMGYDPTNGLYMGNATPGSAPFRVTTAGAATMTGASVSGGITATTLTANGSGSIAGWTIDSAKLSQGNTGIGASGTYRMWSGNLSSPSLANFSVDSSGNIKSAGGTVGGMTVGSAAMTLSGVGGIGSSGGYHLWTGSSTPASAEFRVTSAGAMTATNGSFAGSLSGATGSFTGSVTTSSLDANGGTLGNLTVDGTITLGGGGSIEWESGGSFITSSGIRIGGAFPGGLELTSSGTVRGQLSAGSGGPTLSYQPWGTGTGYHTASSIAATMGVFNVIGSIVVQYNSGSPRIDYQVGSNGQHNFSVGSSGSVRFNGLTKGGSTGTWTGNEPAGASWVNINIDGTTYRLAIWANS